ncbi:uncharacterized protein ACRADG_009987 [Cochliomyia hominivorax]
MKVGKYLLWHFVQNYCLLLGFTTIVIDFKQLRVKIYKSIKIYVNFVNCVQLYFLCKISCYHFSSYYAKNFNFLNLFSWAFILVTRCMFGFTVIAMRLKRDNELRSWLKKLFSFYSQYILKYSNNSRSFLLRKLWIMNIIILLLHDINSIIYVYKLLITDEDEVSIRLDICFIRSQMDMQHIIMLHHACALCYIYECFCLINQQLKPETDISNMNFMYFHLCLLLKELNKIYSPIIFCLQLNFIMTISLLLFTYITFIFLNDVSSFDWMFALNGISSVLLIIHISVYYFICHKIGRLNFDTYVILLKFPYMDYKQEVYLNYLENISFNHALDEIGVVVYGIIKVNLSYLFDISAQIIEYFIILLQVYIQAVFL